MIKQGHTYRDKRTGSKVMAMECAGVVQMASVREVNADELWLGREYVAHVDWLVELPQRYLNGGHDGE